LAGASGGQAGEPVAWLQIVGVQALRLAGDQSVGSAWAPRIAKPVSPARAMSTAELITGSKALYD